MQAIILSGNSNINVICKANNFSGNMHIGMHKGILRKRKAREREKEMESCKYLKVVVAAVVVEVAMM